MPIYEYTCPLHGTFEVLLSSWRQRKNQVKCEKCGSVSVLECSLTTMFPDDSWHTGIHVAGQHYASKRQAQQGMKERGIAQVEPGMQVGKRGQGNAARRRQHLEKHLEGYAV